MPPGIAAPVPRLTNPTITSVTPGMMMNRGQPNELKSTANSCTTREKRPTTTSTTPRAIPEPLRRIGLGGAPMSGGGAGANGGGGSVVAIGASAGSIDASEASGSGSGGISASLTAAVSAAASFVRAQMSGVP